MVEELIAEGVAPEDIELLLVSQFGLSPGDAFLAVQTAQGKPGDVLEEVEDAEYDDDADEEDGLTAAVFDPALHPRYESGRREGGRFAPKAGTSTAQAQAQAEDASAEAQHVDAEIAAPDKLGAKVELEDKFINVGGDFYELGKLDDTELGMYADWADQVAFDLDNDPEYLGFAANARQVMEQRAADRISMAAVQPGVVGNVQPMNVNSMNPVFKGELDGQQVVVKPQKSLSGANVRTFVEPGFDLEREEAAAHVGQLLREDDPSVAPNVLPYTQHEVPGLGRSGVTPFVNGQTVALLETTFPDKVGGMIAPDIRKIRLYDAVIGNTDRHTGNIMVTYPSGQVFPIDHGLAFPSVNSEDWPALQGGPMVTELEPHERGALERLRPRLAADTKLPTLLTDEQIRAMDDRIGFMLHTNRIINTTDWQNGLEDG